MPGALRYGLIVVGSVVWAVGLMSQLHSLSTAATYLALSLAMVLVAAL